MKNKTFLTLVVFAGFLLFISGKTFSQPLYVENFNYPASDLITTHGWTAHSGSGTNAIAVSGIPIYYAGYASNGYGNTVALTLSGEDDNHTFTSQTTGSVYAAFLVNIMMVNTTGDYFFHLGPDPIGTTFRGRVFAKDDGAGNLLFGISKASTTIINYSPTLYSYNTTYLLVVKYTFVVGAANDNVELFINPDISGAEPASTLTYTDVASTDLANCGSVALRQGANVPVAIIDGIRIATNWDDAVKAPTMTVNGITTSKATLNWSAFSGATNYKIAYAPVGTTNYGYKVTSSTSVALTGLTQGTDYFWRVCPDYGAGWMYFSAADTFTTLTPPSLTVNTISYNRATLIWSGFTGAVNYKIVYAPTGTTNYGYKSTAGTSITLPTLAPNTEYFWKVSADYGSGFTAFTPADTFTTTNPVLIATPVSPTEEDLSWTGIEGAVNYKIMYYKTGFTSYIYKFSVVPSISLTGLTLGTDYTWKVSADYGSGWTSYTPTSTFTTNSSKLQNLNTAELAEGISDVNIYPNPTAGNTMLSFVSDQAGTAHIKLFNMMGQMINTEAIEITEGINLHLIELTDMPQGMYIVAVNINDKSIYVRISKE
ncbi:MAG: T9SS type A sorting domain-containing protein [Bacteroidota bacterium]